MLTQVEARERVQRGAAHLDRVRPGWHDRIDVGTLTLRDPCSCIVGQLCGGAFQMEEIGLAGNYRMFAASVLDDSVRHGFEVEYSGAEGWLATRRASFDQLQHAWIDAIAARRHPVTVDTEELITVGIS